MKKKLIINTDDLRIREVLDENAWVDIQDDKTILGTYIITDLNKSNAKIMFFNFKDDNKSHKEFLDTYKKYPFFYNPETKDIIRGV